MGNENMYNNAGSNDKCPKCGAVRPFSAIRCPACGAEYASVAKSTNSAASGNGTFVNRPVNNFDLNASFSAYKKSIEPQPETPEVNESGAAQTEASSLAGNIAEQAKPVELDPIAKKLQAMAKESSVSAPSGASASISGASTQSSSYQSQQFRSIQSQGAPIPGVYIPGTSNQSTSYQGGQTQSTSPQPSHYQNTAPQMRFQGRPDIQQQPAGQAGAQGDGASSPYSSPYQSPYSRSMVSSEPEKKSSPVFKIILVVLFLAVLAMFGYGAYKYYNCDKNDDGVSYSTGKSENGVYTNDWAEVKIDLDTGLQDYTALVHTADIQSSVNNLNNSLKGRNGSVEAIFLGAKLFKTGSYSTPVPGVVMFVITDESFDAKLFGTNLDTFFDDITLSTSGLPAGSSITQVADMILSGKSYRTYRMSFPMEGVGTMDMYMCARAIGNRIVLFYLYSIPGYYDINTVKGYFIN